MTSDRRLALLLCLAWLAMGALHFALCGIFGG